MFLSSGGIVSAALSKYRFFCEPVGELRMFYTTTLCVSKITIRTVVSTAKSGDLMAMQPPSLAESIRNFSFISQREARLIVRRCQKWIEERKSFPTVSKS